MKRILFLLVSTFLIYQANAQFTGTDSLRNYNNRYITNNPATAFTNLRLNTLLRGMIDYIDTARVGTGGGGALGVDTLYALNDSIIRYRKNGVFRNTVLKGVYDTRKKVDTIYKSNDSTLKFTINGVERTIIMPGNIGAAQLTDSSFTVGNDTITIRGTGGGSPGGIDEDIQYNDSSAFGGSLGRFTWNNTTKRLSLLSTSATATPTWLNDHDFKVIGNRMYLGDTTSGEPTFIEFGDPYGQSNSTKMRMNIGWSGTEEGNWWVNAHYRGQVHQKYDSTKFAQWLAMNTHYFLMQAQGIGYDWNDIAGSRVTWRFDNIESGNAVLGGRLTTNELRLADLTTTDYDQVNGTMARFGVSNAALNISGVTDYNFVDSANVGISMMPDMGYRLSIKTTGSKAPTLFWNDDNNSNNMLNRFLRTKSGSYTLSTGTKVGFDANSVASLYFKSTSDAPAGFSSFDLVVNTQNSSGTIAERFWFGQNGDYRIGASTEDATALLNMSSTTRGVLFPRMTTTQQDAISSPTTGLMIVNTDSIASSPLRIYNGTSWASVASGGGGGSSYTFQNGIGASGTTVEWGGSALSHDTKLDVDGNFLRFVDGSATRFKMYSTGESVFTNQLIIGDSTADDTNNLLELEKVGADTRWGMYNQDNNAHTNYFRFIKNRSGSYDLTDNDPIAFFDFNTLGYIKAIAGGTSTGGFKPFHLIWGTTDNSGTLAERMRLVNTGNLLIGTSTDAGEKLNVAGSVRLKVSGVLKNTTILTDTSNIRLTQNIRNAADNADSITNGVATGNSFGSTLYHMRNTTVYSHLDLHETSNTARAELEVTNNLAGTLLNDGAGIQMKQGNITIVAKDSFEIPSVKVTHADSAFVVGDYDPTSGTNKVLKIPAGSGEWTPTLTGDANVDGTPTILHATYTRNGNIVTCYITVAVDPTANTTQTEVGITLPFPSGFTDSNDLSGSGAGSAGNGRANFVQFTANTMDDRATLIFESGSTSSSIVTGTFQYKIL